MIDVDYILALEQNLRSYLTEHKVTLKHWLNPCLIILIQLYERYPDHIRQSKFVDVLHDKQSIQRSVNQLSQLGLVIVSKCKTKGNDANILTITDQGKILIEHADPDNE